MFHKVRTTNGTGVAAGLGSIKYITSSRSSHCVSLILSVCLVRLVKLVFLEYEHGLCFNRFQSPTVTKRESKGMCFVSGNLTEVRVI